jgi:septum formation protein
MSANREPPLGSGNPAPPCRPGRVSSRPAAQGRGGAPDFDLILASGSPRRRELLARAGLAFRVVVPDIDETPLPRELPAVFARRAALDKALAVADRLGPARRARAVIGCDTIVVLGRRILGKPRDAADARRMLRALSGRTHQVTSGIAVVVDRPGHPRRSVARTISTDVVFRRLDTAGIEAYIAGGDPMDKAGAYGIQEGAAHMVRGIRGSYTNVVGLPMAELLALLVRTQAAVNRGPTGLAVRAVNRGPTGRAVRTQANHRGPTGLAVRAVNRGPTGLVPVGSQNEARRPEDRRAAARARKPRRSPT